MPEISVVKHYFVDESGDPTLFNSKGECIAGREGCSGHFILGALDVTDPASLSLRLGHLHGEIRNDPFYKGVESLRAERGKTADMLHAKDDIPEIRERVFKLLATEDIRFYAVVRDKHSLAADVLNRNRVSQSYHYHPNRLYDEMVKRLFKNRLHKESGYRICFAKRGTSDRTEAMKLALEEARANFRRMWNIVGTAPIEVSSLSSKEHYALQAADYFLWAIQRLYAKGEDRYVRFLWPRIGLVHDVDDRRKAPTAMYYAEKNPLTGDAIKKRPGI